MTFTQHAPEERTGTAINIVAKEGTFSEETRQALLDYCYSLQFYEHGKIVVTLEGGATLLIGEGKETLAWVTLRRNQLVVQDNGCGIALEVAHHQLFVPSASTKPSSKSAIQGCSLPEFKTFKGKKKSSPHVLIAINGVIVIDLPFTSESKNDLLIRMPPSTRLTLARDAIEFSENGKGAVLYLKKVIRETVRQGLTVEGNSELLLSLYEGLQEWEGAVPSVKGVKLSTYLEQTIQKALKRDRHLVLYPLERKHELQEFLPKKSETTLIPFPSALVFNDFSQFENLLVQSQQPMSELELQGLRKEVIQGKALLFIEDRALPKIVGTEVSQVTALGMKGLIFAPRSLLTQGITKKQLQFTLVARFADEGKEIFPARSKISTTLPPSIAELHAPHQFLFVTGRDHLPTFNDTIILAEKRTRGLFSKLDKEPFRKVWEKSGEAMCTAALAHGHFFSWREMGRFPALISTEKTFYRWLALVTDPNGGESTAEKALKSLIIFDQKEGAYWMIEEVESALAYLKQTDQQLISTEKERENRCYLYFRVEKLALCLTNSDFKTQFFTKMTSTQVGTLYFEWLFANLGISDSEGALFTSEEAFWPYQNSENYLENCFQTFLGNKNTKKIIASRSFQTFHPETWKTLDPFLDYTQCDFAIPKILPLLLLQEELVSKNGLSSSSRESLELCVKNLIASYHRYLTIKPGDFRSKYGNTITYPFYDPWRRSHSEFECTLSDIVALFATLQNKPVLVEKLLSLFTQEMNSRLDVDKRNRALEKEEGEAALWDILHHNGLALLSLVKKKGIDDAFIETVLLYTETPLDLNLISIILL
ncbi:MAG TPA: hypothetical protein VIH61_09675, partial [Waddliaceae bacterium]